MDGTGYHYARLYRKVSSEVPNARGDYMASSGNPELLRWLCVAVGAVAAAAVTAAGVAQIAKIKAQNPYSSSDVDSGSYTASMPIMQEYSPDYFSNITGAQDTQQLANALASNPIKAYVVEEEVTAKQEVARQRDKETTF